MYFLSTSRGDFRANPPSQIWQYRNFVMSGAGPLNPFSCRLHKYNLMVPALYVFYTHIHIFTSFMCSLCRDPPFEPKPALQPIVEYLVKEIVRKYPAEICPVCNKRALPSEPKVGTPDVFSRDNILADYL